MARQNLCTNPGAKVDVTGYGYASGGPTVTRVTGLTVGSPPTGYPRSTGGRYSSSGAITTPAGLANAGDQITISFYMLSESLADPVVDLYFMAAGSSVGSPVSIPITSSGAVFRFAITQTVPSGTGVQVYGLIDMYNASVTPCIITGVLIERAASVGTYFDGDSASGSWDGANGNSSSTLADAAAAPNGINIPVGLGQPSTALPAAAPAGLAVSVLLGQPAVAIRAAAPAGLALPVALGQPAVGYALAAAPAGLAVPVALGARAAGELPVVPDGRPRLVTSSRPRTITSSSAPRRIDTSTGGPR